MRFSANFFITKPLIIACALSVATFSQASANDPIVVSSKIDTEGSVLGELIIQTLERNGINTENRLQLGGTSVVRTALEAGEIDLYPEYTGNGAFFFDMTDSPVWNNADEAYETVRERDAEQGLIWLQPASSLSDLRLMDELRRGFFTPPCVGVGVGAVVWLLTCPSASARRF